MTFLELPDSDSNNLLKGFVEIDYNSNSDIKQQEYTIDINNHPGDSPPPVVDLKSLTGNRSVPLPSFSAPDIVSHSDCVWPRHILIEDEDNYRLAKGAICVGCKDIPRTQFSYECERHHTYCKYCLDGIISKAFPHHPHCIIDQHIIHNHQPCVKRDSELIRVYCPYSSNSSISKSNRERNRSKSVHSRKKKKVRKIRRKSEIVDHPSGVYCHKNINCFSVF